MIGDVFDIFATVLPCREIAVVFRAIVSRQIFRLKFDKISLWDSFWSSKKQKMSKIQEKIVGDFFKESLSAIRGLVSKIFFSELDPLKFILTF